jgi:hypothetical protein
MPVVRELADPECADVAVTIEFGIRRRLLPGAHIGDYIEGAESRGELQTGMTGDLLS